MYHEFSMRLNVIIIIIIIIETKLKPRQWSLSARVIWGAPRRFVRALPCALILVAFHLLAIKIRSQKSDNGNKGLNERYSVLVNKNDSNRQKEKQINYYSKNILETTFGKSNLGPPSSQR